MGKTSSCERQEKEKAVPVPWPWESNPSSPSPFGVLAGGGDAQGQKGVNRPEHPKEPGERPKGA